MSQEKTYETKFTVEALEALECAIVEGTKRVKYADKEVEYRSLAEIRQLHSLMAKKLGITKSCKAKKGLFGNKRVIAKSTKGLGDC